MDGMYRLLPIAFPPPSVEYQYLGHYILCILVLLFSQPPNAFQFIMRASTSRHGVEADPCAQAVLSSTWY